MLKGNSLQLRLETQLTAAFGRQYAVLGTSRMLSLLRLRDFYIYIHEKNTYLRAWPLRVAVSLEITTYTDFLA